MTDKASVTRQWGDGEYTFSMGRLQWLKIQKQFELGPLELVRHLALGTWKVDYPREAIRLALQAGGSVVTEAGNIDDPRINRLISDYVDDRIFQAALFAADVLTEMAFPPAEPEQAEKPPPNLDEPQVIDGV